MSRTVTPASLTVERVVDVVAAAPGLTYAEVARRLGGRRASALAAIRAAVAASAVHEGPSTVPSRGGSRRSATGLFPEPLEDAGDLVLPLDVATLRTARARAGISLEAVAGQLGVSRSLVHLWETGRQPMPAWAVRDLPGALEDAQTADLPVRGRDGRRRRELLAAVRRSPGITRHQLARTRATDRRLIEQARRAGQLHEAPTWVRAGRSRHQALGLFPGPRPRADGRRVRLEALRSARQAAGWSYSRMGRHIGIAATTLARWERELDVVPGWAVAGATTALAQARAAARDDRGEVLAAITAEPGQTRKQLLERLQFRTTTGQHIDALLDAGEVHARHAGRRGVRDALYPGPMPAEVLTGEQLRALRRRAGLEQRPVAKALGVHVQAVRDWEAGRRPMTIEQQHQLRAHLESLPSVDELRQQAVVDALAREPLSFHGLDLLELMSRRQLSDAVGALLAAGRIERCRIGTGHRGYRLPG